MESHIAAMVDTIDCLKEKISTQEYIDLYNNLMEINKIKPVVYNKKHRVSYQLKTNICFIEDDDEFKDIKKNTYYDSYEQYQDCEDDVNDNFERTKEIISDSYFYCYSPDVVFYDEDTAITMYKRIGEARKHVCDYMICDDLLEEHQRDVQKYYARYVKEWGDWVRIVNQNSVKITDVEFVANEIYND